MNYKEFNEKITNIRCDLEELANEIQVNWENATTGNEEELLYILMYELQDAADEIAKHEDSEEIKSALENSEKELPF